MSNNLRILYWNCRGASKKRLELLELVQRKNIDIILLNETHLNNSQQFKLPNFHSYITNRPQRLGHPAWGGTAILINRKIVHHQIKITTSSIENTSIQIQVGNKELRLSAVYKKPDTLLLTSDLESLLDTSHYVAIAGDLNAKHQSWNSRRQNTAGNTLANFADKRRDITIAAPTSPTHYPDNPNHNADILDIAILKTGNLRYTIENLTAELSSDHTPIILELQAQGTQTLPPKAFKHTDWTKFNLDTKNIIFDHKKMQTSEHVDQAITELTAKIADLANRNTHVTNTKDQIRNLPINILNAIHKKRKLRKNWQHTRNPDVKTLLNRQTALVHDLMQSHRDNEWVNFLSNIDPTSEGWTKIYKLNKKLMHKRPAVHPLSDNQNILHYDAAAKSEIFADSMEKQFQTPDHTTQTDELVKNAIEEHFKIPYTKNIFFSPGEIQYTIKKLPSQKAPGPDQLTNACLKHCDRKVLLQLCNILNTCTRLEYFPQKWKHATIIMIPKPGKDVKRPVNHRPISLLNTLGKVYEKLILNHLQHYLKDHIRPEQFGFRPSHSTTTQLVKIVDEISINLNKRAKTATAFIDIEKAFDKVWHQGLIYKLIQFQLPIQLLKLLQSFLQLRTFEVRVNDSTSSCRPILAGVPQGSCLSPQLFSAYINDMPQHKDSKTALFADDTMFYASGPTTNCAVKRLQNQIDLTSTWFKDWKVTINPTKTTAVLYANKIPYHTKNILMEANTIKWSTKAKYLGVTIDSKLHFTSHITDTMNKTKAAKHCLFPVINKNSPIPLNMKLYIYKTYLRPILTYAGPAWASNISENSWKKLESTQSGILRTITDSQWFVRNSTIRNSAEIPSIRKYIQTETSKLKSTITSSKFSHISNISRRTSPKQLFINRPISF